MSTFDAGSIRADVELDTTPFKRSLSEMKREGERFAQNRFSPKLDADDSEAKRKINAIKLQLASLSGTTRVNVDVGGGVNEQLDQIAARREALSDDISMSLTLNRYGVVMNQLRTLTQAVSRLDGRTIEIDVDVDTAAARARISVLRRELTSLSRMRVTPQVTPPSGGGGGGGAGNAAAGAGGRLMDLAAGGAAAAAALTPVTTVAAGLTAGLVSLAAAGGGAAAILGGVMVGAIQSYTTVAKEIETANKNLATQKEALAALEPGTDAYAAQLKKVKEAQKQVNEAQAKMTPAMSRFNKAINGAKGAWADLIQKTSPQTFGIMTTVVKGATAMIERMAPVVRAVAPMFQRVANAFKNWAEGAGGTRFMNFIKTNGVPILGSLVAVGRNVIATAGHMVRAFAPVGKSIADSLAGASQKMRDWAEDGGFVRFLAKVREAGPSVREFFKALGGAAINLAKALDNLGPLALLTATGFLKIIASMPTPLLTVLIGVLIAVRAAMLANRVAVALTSTQYLILGRRTIAQTAAAVANRIATAATTAVMRAYRLVILGTAAVQNSLTLATIRARIATVASRIATVAMTVAMRGARIAIMAAAAAHRLLTIAFLTSPIGWLVLALAGLVIAFVLLWKKCEGFRNFWKGLWRGIKSVAGAVWNWLKDNWRTVVVVIVGLITGPFGAGIAYMITHWKQVQRVFTAVWRFIRDNIFAPIGRFFTQTIPRWARTVRDRVTGAWDAMWNAVKRAYQWVRDHIFAPIGRFFTQTIPRWARTLRDVMRAVWDGIAKAISAPYYWIRDKVFAPIGRFFTKTIPGWADKLKDKLGDAWKSVQKVTKNAWNNVVGILEDAVNAGRSIINTLIHGFNNITKFLHIKIKIDDIPEVKFKKFAVGGMVPGPSNYATGGFVPGYAPGQDTVPAMLSPGEGVLTPEAVRGLGGEGFIHAANGRFAGHRGAGMGASSQTAQAVTAGLGGFAKGGMVQNFYLGGMVRGGLRRAGISTGLVTQGEYSNGSLSAGTHTGGGVIDIAANPRNQARMVAALRANGFAAWFRTPAEGFAYHIHAVQMNNPNLSAAARAQVNSYRHGGNGLANGGKDTGAGGFDFMGVLKKSIGKILGNVYKGASALAGGVGGGVLDFLTGNAGGGKGVLGKVVGFASKIAGKVTQQATGPLGEAVLSLLSGSNIAEGLKDPKGKFKDFDGKNKFGGLGNIVRSLGNSTVAGLVRKVVPDFLLAKKKESKFKLSDLFGNLGVGGGGAGVQRWATLASFALRMTGLTGGNKLKDFLGLMQAESGGNPKAINLWDSNAKRGTPSKGLMQVIDPTFRAYHVKGTSNSIWDPLANMAASANYIKHVYGGRIPGSPYYTGVIGATAGLHPVAEHAAELVTQPGTKLFAGGERVYNGRETGNILGGGGGGATTYVPATVIVQIGQEQFEGTVVGIMDDAMGAADRSR